MRHFLPSPFFLDFFLSSLLLPFAFFALFGFSFSSATAPEASAGANIFFDPPSSADGNSGNLPVFKSFKKEWDSEIEREREL